VNSVAIPNVGGAIDAVVNVPGSKSLTNRALLVAALANGESILHNALFCEDSNIFSTCLRQLGISVDDQPTLPAYRIDGLGGAVPNRKTALFVGNAGTAARFVTAMLSLSEGE
jgi:3-phosphoshikimate 1-carboxyvinyltransferase